MELYGDRRRLDDDTYVHSVLRSPSMSARSTTRALFAAAMSAGVVLALGASTALAHVGTDKEELVAGASTTLTFSIGHGCEESPTNSMKFQVPEGVLNAVPVVKAGWTIEIEKEQLAEAVEAGHGEEQTDRTAVITYTAQEGYAVENGFRDNFTLAFAAPETAGQLFFKIIQGCETGENAWIDEWDGTGDEPEHPAPSVMVVASPEGEADGHGHDEATDTTEAGESTDSVVDVTETSDDSGDSGDDGSNGLAIVGIVVGALGLLVGGVALSRTRSSKTG
jgi:uncharacterized protein YcnI